MLSARPMYGWVVTSVLAWDSHPYETEQALVRAIGRSGVSDTGHVLKQQTPQGDISFDN